MFVIMAHLGGIGFLGCPVFDVLGEQLADSAGDECCRDEGAFLRHFHDGIDLVCDVRVGDAVEDVGHDPSVHGLPGAADFLCADSLAGLDGFFPAFPVFGGLAVWAGGFGFLDGEVELCDGVIALGQGGDIEVWRDEFGGHPAVSVFDFVAGCAAVGFTVEDAVPNHGAVVGEEDERFGAVELDSLFEQGEVGFEAEESDELFGPWFEQGGFLLVGSGGRAVVCPGYEHVLDEVGDIAASLDERGDIGDWGQHSWCRHIAPFVMIISKIRARVNDFGQIFLDCLECVVKLSQDGWCVNEETSCD